MSGKRSQITISCAPLKTNDGHQGSLSSLQCDLDILAASDNSSYGLAIGCSRWFNVCLWRGVVVGRRGVLVALSR